MYRGSGGHCRAAGGGRCRVMLQDEPLPTNVTNVALNNLKAVPLEISLLPGEVCRKLGCLAQRIGPDQQKALVERLLGQALSVVHGAAVYRIFPIKQITTHRLDLPDCPPILGPVDNHLQPARRVVVFATTLGTELENLIRLRTAEEKCIESSVLQAIADAALNAAVDALADHLHWNEMDSEECLTPPLIPGCCGFDFEQVETLLGILDPRPIGLEILPGPTLKPTLSSAGLFGIAPQSKMEEYGIPCAHCGLKACRLQPRKESHHFD